MNAREKQNQRIWKQHTNLYILNRFHNTLTDRSVLTEMIHYISRAGHAVTHLNFNWHNLGTLPKDHSRNTMPKRPKMIPFLRVENPKNHTLSGGTNLSRRDAKTSCLVIQTERFYLAWCRTRAFASTSDWPVRMSTSAMWLARWVTVVFVSCKWSMTFQRSVQYSLNRIPRSLYTHVIYPCPYWNITVSFCSFPQLHMVFDGPGEELAVVALWIKVHPVYFSGYFSLIPSNNK